MPTHIEKREFPFSPEQLFDLVAAVDRYPEFLPWCRAARVTQREENRIRADLVVGFKIFRERFTCEVKLDRPGTIEVDYLKGPMRHLNNRWCFSAKPEGGSVVDFYVDFEFHSPLMQRVGLLLFNDAVRHMVSAFERRAHSLYATRIK